MPTTVQLPRVKGMYARNFCENVEIGLGIFEYKDIMTELTLIQNSMKARFPGKFKEIALFSIYDINI